MSRFFVNRPIVAIVISILMVIIGLVTAMRLPIAQFPAIVPPEITVNATYTGADAQTVEVAVATPLEQQMSGVDRMNYMYSLNANDGSTKLTVDFGVDTDPNTDLILTQLRESQAQAQLPIEVQSTGVIVQKSTSSPLMVLTVASPKGTYDETFLANYAYININDRLLRVPGISNITVFGAGQYAMRVWVKPDTLAKLGITVTDIISALKTQNKVNPSGQIGAPPIPAGQEFTYTVTAPGRLTSEADFNSVVIRANPDGSLVRIRDVGRVEMGAQVYSTRGRMNGMPAAALALYQLPGSNALDAAEGVRKTMDEIAKSFPPDLEYAVAMDTTLAVTEGMKEIMETLYEALLLVVFVVFLFLQGWRATLIPAIAVPVSLIGTFAFFPAVDFSVNTLTMFGLVLAIGLVVDDAIVVVEAVEHHIEHGLSPKQATLKAMEEVTGPVIATSLALIAVFVPTVFIPGITGLLYQQFALTISISVAISTFNALSLSPALAALMLRPKTESHGLMGRFFAGFNHYFGITTQGYVNTSGVLIRKSALAIGFLVAIVAMVGVLGKSVPAGFLPDEDNGYMYLNIQLPEAASMERSYAVCEKIDEILKETPGIKYYTALTGFSLLSSVKLSYSAFYFISLEEWAKRKKPEEKYEAIQTYLNHKLAGIAEARAFAFSPPPIPGIGTAAGVTFILEDRAGHDFAYLAQNTQAFMEALRKRPEFRMVTTTLIPTVPQLHIDVDRDKVLKQGVDLKAVYDTLQTFMGGYFVNYFNRFGRQWQMYVQADGDYRTNADNVGLFFVRDGAGNPVPLSSLVKVEKTAGPEFSMRYNLYRSAQINAMMAPGYSSGQAMAAMEEVFHDTMPSDMGYDYLGMSFQEKMAQQGVSPSVIFALSFLFVFLILAAQYESWSLPFSVLLSTPIAVFGAFLAVWIRGQENNIYAQIGLVMLIGLAAKNAILIVEFARMEYEKGKSLRDAALEAARLRLRPLLMTAFAFILGSVPLAISEGAGGHSRQIMGTVVIGGMLAATLLAIFIIPVLFTLIGRFTPRRSESAEGGEPPAAPEHHAQQTGQP
ncbi:MAG: hypothetical protein RIQ52_1694 [Pseudomonadota bacterium]